MRTTFRIRLLGGVLLLTVLALATAQDLVVNSYGGEYEELIHEAIIEPFEEQFDVDVLYDATGSAAEDYARIRATRGNPGFDVVVMTAPESLQGCREELLMPLTEENVPNIAELNRDVMATVGDCGAVHEIQYMSLMWRTDHVDQPLTSWQELWDPQYEGHVVIPDITSIMAVYLLQMASVINDGTLSDLDPGFEAIAELAPRTAAIESSSSIMRQYVERDEGWILPYWSGRAQLMKDEGLPVDFTIPEEGTIPLLSTLNVPINAEHKELALEFINFWLEKTQQEAWALAYKVGSARSDLELPEEFAARQITSSEDLEQLLLPDQMEIAQRRSEWTERWQRDIRR